MTYKLRGRLISGGQEVLVDPLTIPSSGISFNKNQVDVDSSFLLSRVISLAESPIDHSDLVFVNGIFLDPSCYTIIGTTLTLDGSLNIGVGDVIDVSYAS